jgi:hypothetical protein
MITLMIRQSVCEETARSHVFACSMSRTQQQICQASRLQCSVSKPGLQTYEEEEVLNTNSSIRLHLLWRGEVCADELSDCA